MTECGAPGNLRPNSAWFSADRTHVATASDDTTARVWDLRGEPPTFAALGRPGNEYGIGKAQIEAYLIEMARKESFPATIIHPGHIANGGNSPSLRERVKSTLSAPSRLVL